MLSNWTLFAVFCAACCLVGPFAAKGLDDPYKAADDAIVHFMDSNHIHAASLAISRQGVLLHERAFGFADRELHMPMTPQFSMRIASVSKPITAAAIRSLVREDKLRLTDPVLKYLPSPRYPPPVDERWKAITIGEVLQHSGGWDRAVSGDPMFKNRLIMRDLKTNSVTPREVVRWMLGQRLDFAPGSKTAYSNFGYCLLGVVIQEVSGSPYAEFVKSTVVRRANMSSLTLSSTRPSARSRSETWYDFGMETPYLIEPMEANAGWSCTAADLTRFLDRFWINGEPRNGGRGSWFFFGTLPGTTSVAVQRPDGINYALLMNKRDPAGNWNGKLKALLDGALTAPTQR
jgi:CubicO group peptidase (beta-lactamase class C family)